ncbi:7211_t:CDS:2 [Entrophospora sp. SA101]|nr:7211_t:CDS:2 [Entrophospora sp. SA101]
MERQFLMEEEILYFDKIGFLCLCDTSLTMYRSQLMEYNRNVSKKPLVKVKRIHMKHITENKSLEDSSIHEVDSSNCISEGKKFYVNV